MTRVILLGSSPIEEDLRAAVKSLYSLGQSHWLPDVLDAQVEGCVHTLLVTGGNRPNLKKPSAKKISANLRHIADLAKKLNTALSGLDECSASVFADVPKLKRTIRVIELISEESCAADRAAETWAVYKRTKSDALPRLDPVERLALKAAFVFLTMTGKKPTIINSEKPIEGALHRRPAYGPFMDFLTKVFKARGIQASVEATAKIAVRAIGETRNMEFKPVKNQRKTPFPRRISIR